MEEAATKTKPKEESSPAEDGSPLAPEPKRQRISGEEEDGAGAGAGGGGGGAKEEEDVEWEDVDTNADEYIAEFKAIEQNLKINREHLAQLRANFGQDEDYKNFVSAVKKSCRDVSNILKQLIESCETMQHGPSDEEPVNSSLPDDAEVKSPNDGQ